MSDDEGSASGLSAVVPLKISLLDSNDNAPIFTNQNYSAVIDEGATGFEPPLVVEVQIHKPLPQSTLFFFIS